ncbi:MAG: AAA family ATPase, partial [Eubacteriales bacterium]
MKKRDLYLNKLIAFKDKPLIKVITGMRRCGKSTLLSLFEQYLIANGVGKDCIISINFETMKVD